MINITLSILKPDAVSKNLIGKIYSKIEQAGIKIILPKMIYLTSIEAKNFYFIHKNENFFTSLINFMISGPIIVQILQSYNIIEKSRKLIGNTDPKKSNIGTIRYDFATNIERNVIHSSDSYSNAIKEINFFYSKLEIIRNITNI